jgi:hypothetical protein
VLARVAESADAQVLGTCSGNGVGVQVPPRAFCRVEKWSSRLAHNQEITGSNPVPAIYFPYIKQGINEKCY